MFNIFIFSSRKTEASVSFKGCGIIIIQPSLWKMFERAKIFYEKTWKKTEIWLSHRTLSYYSGRSSCLSFTKLRYHNNINTIFFQGSCLSQEKVRQTQNIDWSWNYEIQLNILSCYMNKKLAEIFQIVFKEGKYFSLHLVNIFPLNLVKIIRITISELFNISF